MTSVLQEILARGDLEAMLKLTEEQVKSEEFDTVFSDLQDLVWTKSCLGEIKVSLALSEMLKPYERDLLRHKTVQNTLLHEAVLKASADIVAQLLTVIDQNERNSAGQTPLMVLLSHNPADLQAKVQLLHSAPLACDLRLRTTCHYILRSSLPPVTPT